MQSTINFQHTFPSPHGTKIITTYAVDLISIKYGRWIKEGQEFGNARRANISRQTILNY